MAYYPPRKQVTAPRAALGQVPASCGQVRGDQPTARPKECFWSRWLARGAILLLHRPRLAVCSLSNAHKCRDGKKKKLAENVTTFGWQIGLKLLRWESFLWPDIWPTSDRIYSNWSVNTLDCRPQWTSTFKVAWKSFVPRLTQRLIERNISSISYLPSYRCHLLARLLNLHLIDTVESCWSAMLAGKAL